MSAILTVDEAAAEARRDPQTVRRALVAGELHGTQRKVRGRWSIRMACLDAWIDNTLCEHRANNVSAIAGRVRKSA